MLSRLGPWEIALILVVILFVFGAGKLPQVGSSIGKAIREFRKAQQDEPNRAEKVKNSKAAKRTKKSQHTSGS